MNRNLGRAAASRGRRGAGVMAVAMVLGSFVLTSCGVVSAVRKVERDVRGNKATIDTFTNTIKSSQGTTFEATYVTTGSTPDSSNGPKLCRAFSRVASITGDALP